MKRFVIASCVCAVAWSWTAASLGQATRPARASTTRPARRPTTRPVGLAPGTGETVVTVNGHKFTQGDIDELVRALLDWERPGQPTNPRRFAQRRTGYRKRIIQTLVGNHLLAAELDKADIKVTDQELIDEMEAWTDDSLSSSAMARDDYAQKIHNGLGGMSLEEFMRLRATNPFTRARSLHTRLLAKRSPEEIEVSEEEIKASYDKNLKRAYSKPELVRASHILVKPEAGAPDGGKGPGKEISDEAKAVARKKIDEILAEVKKPEADFAALAKKHSACPSSAKGGDLDFFPRKRAMAEAFAAAAYALEKGGISDVVETRHGYHIILCTDRKEAKTITLDEARGAIRSQIKYGKVAAAKTKLVASLEEPAEIEYANEKDKPDPPRPPTPVGARPATRPAGAGAAAKKDK